MPQLHLYVPEDVAKRVRQRAEAKGVSVSQLLAQIVKREFHSGWPEGFFERVAGSWEGAPLVRPDQGVAEERDFGFDKEPNEEPVTETAS